MSTPSPGWDWDRLRALYHRAAGLRPAQRAALLDDLRRDEAELAAKLESLIIATDPGTRLFDSLERTLFAVEDGVEDPVELIPKVDPLYGTRLGPYRIDTLIGRGGMGIVYRARHTELDVVRALKLIPTYDAASPEARRRFLAEARSMARVCHPNVGGIHEIAESEDGRLYLAMPYYEGISLKARLAGGALPVDEALDWFRQACAGLAAVHAAGIIHRDVTPGNLLRTEEGTVKLLDFGLAKIAEATLGTGNRPLGTIGYMSPEQLRGGPVDHRADSWSMGVVLYEMLWGERPFRGRTPSAIRGQILDDAPVSIPVLPAGADPALEQMLEQLLSREPPARPAPSELTLDG